MITKFPALVYRCPGPHAGPHGKTYDARPVASPEALEAALSDGWQWSLEDAALGLPPPAPVEAHPAWPSQPEALQDPIDKRAMMVAQAEKLGIDVDGRWSEKRLRHEIDAAVKAASL